MGGLAVSAPAEPRLTRDIDIASSGIEPELTGRAEMLEVLPGVSVPVAIAADLIALKVLARDDRTRPQDYDDLRALLCRVSPSEVERAREALQLIARRGYGRNRDLVQQLDQLLTSL